MTALPLGIEREGTARMGTQENHFQVKESKAPELTALDITEDIYEI